MARVKRKRRVTLEQQIRDAEESLERARALRNILRAEWEKKHFAEFAEKWVGKIFRYEVGGPDLIRYGRVIGVSKEEERRLDVMEVSLDDKYNWVELQRMDWDIGRFEYYKAEILSPAQIEDFYKKLYTYLILNLFDLNVTVNPQRIKGKK